MGLHEQAPLGSPLLGTLGYSRPVGALEETTLLQQLAHEHPLQAKVKVRDECKPGFCAHGRQEPLKESGASMEQGPSHQRRVPSAATATLLPGAHGREASTPLLN